MQKVMTLLAAAVLAACAGSGSTPVSGEIDVVATDYQFGGVPALVAPGATLMMTDAPTAEVHEMVVRARAIRHALLDPSGHRPGGRQGGVGFGRQGRTRPGRGSPSLHPGVIAEFTVEG